MPLPTETPEQREARLEAFYAKVSANVFSAEGRRVWEGRPDVRTSKRVSDAEFDLYTAQAGEGFYR